MKLFIALMFVAFSVHAQNAREKTFPIGKPFPATMVVCEKKEVAISLAKNPKLYQKLAEKEQCVAISAMVVYNKAVYRGKFSVYEVVVEGLTLYSITDWTAEQI